MSIHGSRIVSASRVIEAPADVIFDLIADPARQPEWDGNANLLSAHPGQRVHAVGDVFVTTLEDHLPGTPPERESHVVEFDEGRVVAWKPSLPGDTCPGHLWRWELSAIDESSTRVTHTYDWSDLHDERRQARAAATDETYLRASLDRLASAAEFEAMSQEASDRATVVLGTWPGLRRGLEALGATLTCTEPLTDGRLAGARGRSLQPDPDGGLLYVWVDDRDRLFYVGVGERSGVVSRVANELSWSTGEFRHWHGRTANMHRLRVRLIHVEKCEPPSDASWSGQWNELRSKKSLVGSLEPIMIRMAGYLGSVPIPLNAQYNSAWGGGGAQITDLADSIAHAVLLAAVELGDGSATYSTPALIRLSRAFGGRSGVESLLGYCPDTP